MNDKSIISDFFPIKELYSTIGEFISEYFKIFPKNIEDKIKQLEQLLKKDLKCYIEYPYVEKVYRDSFYNYYSTKHNSTNRNCARISFFSKDVSLIDFRNQEAFTKINDHFFGYITIRPTIPNLIGRSMLSPFAYKQSNWLCCLTESNVVINGVKLKVKSFPHSSQDGETITCAETTIWSVMEYFGNENSDYKTVLPSKIISVLSQFSYERQLPSKGLTAEQISFALREFGFGTRLYAQRDENGKNGDTEAYSEKEFKRLLGYYVESGIPIIASVENDNLGHAIVIIGRSPINHGDIDFSLYESTDIETKSGKIKLYEYVDFIKEYIVIDDNMPPYNNITFENPTCNYNDTQFSGCKIKNFIAPLYHKIYLEAGGARELMISYLESFEHDLPGNIFILKLFFISSRSFKVELNERIDIGEEANELILNLTMPKYIWVGVLSNPELLKQSKANGLIVLDATETNVEDARILMVSPKRITTYNSQEDLSSKYAKYDLDIKNFSIFANNLKNCV